MRIARIEFYDIRVPLPVPFLPSWAPGYTAWQTNYTFLRISTDTGLQGFATGMCAYHEHRGLAEVITPYLIGVDPTDIPQIHQRLYEASIFGWRNFWIEAAFWDIKAKSMGQPVWKLLGATGTNKVRLYASTGELHSPEQRAEEVIRLAEMGFKAVKLRVHNARIEDDIAQVEAVTRVVGRDLDILVDANQGRIRTSAGYAPRWELERAIAFAHACEDYGVRWLEEPLNEYAYDELAELRRVAKLPIAGGELNNGWHEIKIMFEKGCFDIYQPDALWGGGITDSIRVLETCRNQGLGYSPHTWSNGLGFLINLHLHVAGDQEYPLEYPYDPPTWVPEVRDAILIEPIQFMSDGTISVPQTPGFGIVVDEQKLSRYGEKFFDLSL